MRRTLVRRHPLCRCLHGILLIPPCRSLPPLRYKIELELYDPGKLTQAPSYVGPLVRSSPSRNYDFGVLTLVPEVVNSDTRAVKFLFGGKYLRAAEKISTPPNPYAQLFRQTTFTALCD